MNRLQKSVIFTLLPLLVVSIVLLFSQPRVSAAKSPDYSNIRSLIESVKKVPNEKRTAKQSTDAHIMAKTKKRIVEFNKALTQTEIEAIEKEYSVKFEPKKSKKPRYLVTPSNETKFEALANTENVMTVSSESTYKIEAQSTDWGVYKMNIPAAWSYANQSTGVNVTVAVIDTGVQLDHPDISSAIKAGGYDFVNNDADPSDDNGHGTHVAGIIAATNNSEGTVGAAYGAKILPLKVCDATGSCSSLAIADAIDFAVGANVDIINLSLGGGANDFIQAAIDRATVAGVIVAAASGNTGENGCLYPAAYENVVCVGSIDNSDAKSSFSNYGTGLDVVAPGTGILSLGLGGTTITHS